MNKSYYQDVPVFLKPKEKQRRKPKQATTKEVKIAKQMRRNGCKYKHIAMALKRPYGTAYKLVNQ
jgi:hypothetical protein